MVTLIFNVSCLFLAFEVLRGSAASRILYNPIVTDVAPVRHYQTKTNSENKQKTIIKQTIIIIINLIAINLTINNNSY